MAILVSHWLCKVGSSAPDLLTL